MMNQRQRLNPNSLNSWADHLSKINSIGDLVTFEITESLLLNIEKQYRCLSERVPRYRY